MRHSKHLTLLVATLVALILVGVTYYLYLTVLTGPDQNMDVVDTDPVPEVDQQQVEQSLRDRLDPIQTPERTPEEIEALRERLETVETPERTPEEIEALRNRLESM